MRNRPGKTEFEEARDLAALNAVAEAIAGPLSLAAAFDALGRVLVDQLGIAGGVAFLQAGPDGGLVPRANWGVPAGVLAAIEARLRAGWDDPAAIDGLRPADIIPGGDGPFLTLSVEGQDPPWRSCLCIPFWAGAGSPGVLVLCGLASPGDEAARTAVLELLGRLVGAAVLNARLHARAAPRPPPAGGPRAAADPGPGGGAAPHRPRTARGDRPVPRRRPDERDAGP